MKTMISARLPELSIEQIEMLKRFYQLDDEEFWYPEPSTSRILIISINAFWKHIFDNEIQDPRLESIRKTVLEEYNKTTG